MVSRLSAAGAGFFLDGSLDTGYLWGMMNEGSSLGLWLIGMGVLLIVVGGVVWLFSTLGGRLPLDIVIRKDSLTVFLPIGTSLLVSLLLTVILNLVFFFLRPR